MHTGFALLPESRRDIVVVVGGKLLDEQGADISLIGGGGVHEEAFAVELCRDGELEVVAMHGYRAFALVAVGRKPTQVNHVVVWKQFSRVEPVEEFVVVGEQRFDTRRMQEQQPLRTKMTVAEDADVAVAP